MLDLSVLLTISQELLAIVRLVNGYVFEGCAFGKM